MEYNKNNKYSVINDARAIPPKTTIAIANLLSAPAPELIINGMDPNNVDLSLIHI